MKYYHFILLYFLFIGVVYSVEQYHGGDPDRVFSFSVDPVVGSNDVNDICDSKLIRFSDYIDYAYIAEDVHVNTHCSEAKVGYDCDVDFYENNGYVTNNYGFGDFEIVLVSDSEFNILKSEPHFYQCENAFSAFTNNFLGYYHKGGALLFNGWKKGTKVRYGETHVNVGCKGNIRVELLKDGNVIYTKTTSLTSPENLGSYEINEPGSYAIKYTLTLTGCVGYLRERGVCSNTLSAIHPFLDGISSTDLPIISTDSTSFKVKSSSDHHISCVIVPDNTIKRDCHPNPFGSGQICFNLVRESCFKEGDYGSSKFWLDCHNSGDYYAAILLPESVPPNIYEVNTANGKVKLRNFYINPNHDPMLIAPHSSKVIPFDLNALAPIGSASEPDEITHLQSRSSSPSHILKFVLTVGESNGCDEEYNINVQSPAYVCSSDAPNEWDNQDGLNVNVNIDPEYIGLDELENLNHIRIYGDVNSHPDNLIPEAGSATLTELTYLYSRNGGPASLENCILAPVTVNLNNGLYEFSIPKGNLRCNLNYGQKGVITAKVSADYNDLVGSGQATANVDTTMSDLNPSCEIYYELIDSNDDYESYSFNVDLKDINNIKSMSYDCGNGGGEHVIDHQSFECIYSTDYNPSSNHVARFTISYDNNGEDSTISCQRLVGVCKVLLG